jgi:protein gp37
MADIFDNRAPQTWRVDFWALIRATPALEWQLLTKRPQNIVGMLPPDWGDGWPNVWLGTTTENQLEAARRVPYLVAIPADPLSFYRAHAGGDRPVPLARSAASRHRWR